MPNGASERGEWKSPQAFVCLACCTFSGVRCGEAARQSEAERCHYFCVLQAYNAMKKMKLRRRATTKPLNGLNGKGWIIVFVLLNSNQPIDRPSKEPPLGLGSFTSLESRMVRFRIVI
ncbi:unnamed protein product [Prunus armeniaca]